MKRSPRLRYATRIRAALVKEFDQASVRGAENLFRKWSEFEPREYLRMPFLWPERQGYEPECEILNTSYFSDKKDGLWKTYVHEHMNPLPRCYGAFQEDCMVEIKPFPPPKSVAILGFALEEEYTGGPSWPKKPDYLDWKNEKYPPFLCGDPSRNLLIIQPQTGGYPLLVWSPIMRITRHGIEF